MHKYRNGRRKKVDYSEEFLIKQVTISKFYCTLLLFCQQTILSNDKDENESYSTSNGGFLLKNSKYDLTFSLMR